tara:strand:- start:564 stop:956 length:393 start_codon:yes stop_codon:yes gene_type:complete
MNKITRIKKLKEAMLIDKQNKLVKYEKQLNEKADYVSKLIDTLEMIYPPEDKRGRSDLVFHRKWERLSDRENKFATHFYIKDNKAEFVMPNTKEAHEEMHRIQKKERLERADPALVNSLIANMKKHLGSK